MDGIRTRTAAKVTSPSVSDDHLLVEPAGAACNLGGRYADEIMTTTENQ